MKEMLWEDISVVFMEQLMALSGGTRRGKPLIVKPNIPFTFTTGEQIPDNTVPWGAINAAVWETKRFVVLDLSDCTAEGNRIDGMRRPQDNAMNSILFNEYIKGIILPSTLETIGDSAFQNCFGLTCITIPASVTEIADNAFRYCRDLNCITVGKANSVYASENGVLFHRGKRTLIQYPESKGESFYTIPEGVVSIGDHAFSYSKNLSSVAIPHSVTSMGEHAFYGSSLSSIVIPYTMRSVGEYAFYSCSNLNTVTFEGSQVCINCTFDNILKVLYTVGGLGTYTRINGQNNWVYKGIQL
jgi:hypothetical protein